MMRLVGSTVASSSIRLMLLDCVIVSCSYFEMYCVLYYQCCLECFVHCFF